MSSTVPLSETETTGESIAIIVPAYNEENGLLGVIEELRAIRSQLEIENWRVEIIIVDDGSADRTAEIARKQADITTIQHRANRGYGASLKTGIRHATSNWICITDADGTYPNKRIPDLLVNVVNDELDMVVGARTGEHVVIPLIRRPAKWAIRRLAIFVAGEPIPDINSGLRLFKREVALRFFGILPDGFSFTTTITLGMMTNNYLVNYMPINYHARIGNSKIRPIHDTLNFVQLVMRIALYFKPLKVFVPLSSVIFLIALVWALFSKLILDQLADVTTLIITVTAVQALMIGMLAELINQRLPNTYRE